MVKFSVIIPVRKFNACVREVLDHLATQTFKNFEVIVVLDEMDLAVARAYSNVIFLASDAVGPAEKRNLGVAHAHGEIFAFLDDDAFPADDWLASANKVFEETGTYALGGPAVTPPNSSSLERLSGKILESWLSGGFTTYRHKPLSRRFINDYPSVNLFVRRIEFKKVGGFCHDFWPGEDTKLCLDLIKLKGCDFLYDPSVVAYHHRRALFRPFLKQISRYGRQRGYFSKAFPETSRLPLYYVPTLVLAMTLLGGGLSLFSALVRFSMLYLILLYMWLVAYESWRIARFEKNIKVFGLAFLGFGLTHVVYGVFFVIGTLRRFTLRLREVSDVSGSYLGG